VVFHRVGETERAQALDVKSGTVLWTADFPATYRGGVNPDTGPRCVPLLHGDAVYLFGAAGDLHCVSLQNGKKIWSRRTYEEFSALEGYFGAGSTPIVVDGKLLVNVGGRDDAGLVAFALDSGKTLWKSTQERASYASPTVTKLGGKEMAIFATRLNTVAISPADGTVRGQFAFGQRGPTVNAATPLVFGDYLFVTANYGVGAKLVRISGDGFEEVWSRDDVMSSQYPTPVHHKGYLYGIHGREDVGVAELRCIEVATGAVQWSLPHFGMAHLIGVGEHLLITTIDGRLLLTAASPDRFTSLAEAKISDAVTRALPALADGRLYVRENSTSGGTLKCLDLGGLQRAKRQ
jgi:outer membrane protein assembly factor BamB